MVLSWSSHFLHLKNCYFPNDTFRELLVIRCKVDFKPTRIVVYVIIDDCINVLFPHTFFFFRGNRVASNSKPDIYHQFPHPHRTGCDPTQRCKHLMVLFSHFNNFFFCCCLKHLSVTASAVAVASQAYPLCVCPFRAR